MRTWIRRRWIGFWRATGRKHREIARIARIARIDDLVLLRERRFVARVRFLLDARTEQLRARTKKFAIRVVHLFRSLPPVPDAQIIGKQLLRSGTAVGANYRAACRARSKAEFVSRIGIVTEEADESAFWIELLAELGIMKKERLEDLLRESLELTAIFSASRKTAKER